jgi:hypothetical protein
MIESVSHSRSAETMEAKARWFQSLTMEERADLLCEFTDMILEINPKKDVFSSFQKHNVHYVVIGGNCGHFTWRAARNL